MSEIHVFERGAELRIDEHIGCADFPCKDVNHQAYILPDIDIDPKKISILLISEAAPADAGDYYYAQGSPLFQQTTLEAFKDAGAEVASFREILGLGVYLTTAVKCGKTSYAIEANTVKQCSRILDAEIALFPNLKALLLMGDVAIRAINEIARLNGEKRVIPAGPTYKLRGQAYTFRGARVFPSYLQAGPSFYIEKSKRKMIAQDIAAALHLSN